MKLHGNVINRTQVTLTTKYISLIYVLGSAKVSSMSNIKSKHSSLWLVGSGEIILTINCQKVSFVIDGSGYVDLKGNCKNIKEKFIG